MTEPQKKKLFDTRFTVLVAVQATGILLILITLILVRPSHHGEDPALLREVGNKLQAAGLTSEAISFYQAYLEKADIDTKTQANIAFSLGELSEQQGDLSKALGWYFRVKTLDSRSDHAIEAEKKVVALLEKLGKVTAAKSELESSTYSNQRARHRAQLL